MPAGSAVGAVQPEGVLGGAEQAFEQSSVAGFALDRADRQARRCDPSALRLRQRRGGTERRSSAAVAAGGVRAPAVVEVLEQPWPCSVADRLGVELNAPHRAVECSMPITTPSSVQAISRPSCPSEPETASEW